MYIIILTWLKVAQLNLCAANWKVIYTLQIIMHSLNTHLNNFCYVSYIEFFMHFKVGQMVEKIIQ